MNSSVYDYMMSKPPVIDKSYLSTVLELDKDQAISDIEISQVIETNTALVIKFKAIIEMDNNYYSTRCFFIKTIKYDTDTHAYDSLSLNEVKFYKLVQKLNNPKLPVVKCFDNYISINKTKHLLLLEDVSDEFNATDKVDLCTEEIWLSAASSLAKFHATFWNLNKIGTEDIFIDDKEKVNTNIKNTYECYKKFIDYAGHRLDKETLDIYEHALKISVSQQTERYERLIAKKNITLIHGDSHIYNFMFPRNGSGTPIIIDFQFWSSGIGAGDLAHLTRVAFPEAKRQELHREIVEKYYEVLLTEGVQDYSLDDCWNDYRKEVAAMLMIPVWQYNYFNLKYDYWIGAIHDIVLNYKSLCCDKLKI